VFLWADLVVKAFAVWALIVYIYIVKTHILKVQNVIHCASAWTVN